MGTLNNLQRFIPDLLEVSFRSSRKACNKKKTFLGGEEQNLAFVDILDLIINICNLYHYDALRFSRVKCDAGHSGLGA